MALLAVAPLQALVAVQQRRAFSLGASRPLRPDTRLRAAPIARAAAGGGSNGAGDSGLRWESRNQQASSMGPLLDRTCARHAGSRGRSCRHTAAG